MEMMVGLKTEPGLGTFVVVAAGGVLTELLDDVVIAPAPLAEAEVERVAAPPAVLALLAAGTAGRDTGPSASSSAGSRRWEPSWAAP